MLKGICPNCEAVTNLEFVKQKDSITIKEKPIEIEDQFLRCLACGEEFDDPQSNFDVLESAYKKYHELHGG